MTKKRIPKSARETLEKMAKDSRWCQECGRDKTVPFNPSHVCPPHEHDEDCKECRIFGEWWSVQHPVEKVVYRVPRVIHFLVFSLFLSVGILVALVLNQKPIDKPYPVYHTVYVPDQLCQPKLDDCQADYHKMIDKGCRP